MRLSYSKLLTYRTCPKKYEFKYIQHLKEEETIELIIGKAGHSVLESYYKIPFEDRSQKVINELVSVLLIEPGHIEILLTALDGYHKWATEEAYPKDGDMVKLTPELSMEMNISALDTYEGRIDAVFEHDGMGAILEHKFKKNWSIDYVKNLEYDEQPTSYALLTNIRSVFYNLIRTVPAKTRPKFERIQVIVPEVESNRLVKDALIWKNRIGTDTQLKEFARNRGYHCNWCPFKPQCFNYEAKHE